MELSFVFAALKRRWWVVLIFAELGILPFIIGGGPVETTVFESQARLVILPPSGSRITTTQPDRYVLGQLEILTGRSVAEQVAEQLGSDNVREIRQSSEFVHIPETDVVTVSVREEDPATAQLVLQTIVDTYMARLVAADTAVRGPDLARLEEELLDLRDDLQTVNARIATAYEPWLNPDSEIARPAPSEVALVPNESAERTFIIAEIQRNELLRSTITNTPSGVNTSIVQDASLPTNPITETGGIFEIAFLVGMTLLGVSVALLWARFSRKVLDVHHLSEILQVPVVARLKKSKALKQDPLVAFTRLPQDMIAGVDQIAVQAEALASIDRPLTIAVVGSQRGAATTTVAVALAARFAAAEYSVLLADADRRDPWITDVFGAADHGGVPALLGIVDKGVDRIFTRTSEPDVRVLGLGGSGANLRRESAPALVEASREAANIVIFDGGPLLDAASTVELCNVVDAIVLTVPLSDSRTDDLAVVARQLGSVRSKVLPALTATSRSVASRQTIDANLGADSFALGGGLVAVARAASEGRTSRASSQRMRAEDSDPGKPGSDSPIERRQSDRQTDEADDVSPSARGSANSKAAESAKKKPSRAAKSATQGVDRRKSKARTPAPKGRPERRSANKAKAASTDANRRAAGTKEKPSKPGEKVQKVGAEAQVKDGKSDRPDS